MAGFVIERDPLDHFRFTPIQTNLGQELCKTYDMPSDVSTAILLTENEGYTESDAILRIFFPYLGFPYPLLGFIALFLIPKFLRDFGYRLFAKNRGKIWKNVKLLTGMGDTLMEPYHDRVVGLHGMEKPLPESWGFDKNRKDVKKKN